MPKFIRFIALAICCLAISCQEEAPTIVPCQTDRVVLVEEFTAIACNNCPKGHRKIKELQQIYPDKIIPVAIHSGPFAKPSSNPNGLDWTTVDGNAIRKATPTGDPAIMVNRKYDEKSGTYAIASPPSWAGPIADQLCLPPDATIQVKTEYDNSSRKLKVTVDIAPTNMLKMEENIGLTVLITESHIIAPQEDGSGWIQSYEHNHVLRDIITNTWGDKIQNKGELLSVQQRVVEYSLPTDWEADNCHVVAFVHQQGDLRYVLQAAETSLVP